MPLACQWNDQSHHQWCERFECMCDLLPRVEASSCLHAMFTLTFCVHKHPRPCSTLFYDVIICVLLCVHTRLLCFQTPAAPGTLREGSQSTCGSRVNGNRLRTPSRYVCILVGAHPSRCPQISSPQLFTHTACLHPHSVNTNSLDRAHTTHPPTHPPICLTGRCSL
jgi:hypothetical protein